MMNALSTIYKQLEDLALQQQVDVGVLIKQMIASEDNHNRTSKLQSHGYLNLLQTATSAFTPLHELDDILKHLFEFIDAMLTYDIGLALMNEEEFTVVRYYCEGRSNNINEMWFGLKLQLSDIAFMDQRIDDDGFAILDESDCGKLTVLTKTARVKSALIIPIMNQSSVSGYLLYSSEIADLYDRDIAKMILPFVNLASSAIQNVRLMSIVNQSTDELAALYHATSVLFRADNLIDFASQITDVVVRAFNYADCGLMVINKEDGEIVRIKRSGPKAAHPVNQLNRMGKGLVPKAVREGRIVYEPDVRLSEDYVAGDENSLCELVVPLQTTEGILGVLDFQSMQTHAFSDLDQRIIIAFAERVAPALENVLLYDQLRQHTVELEQHVAQRTLELQKTKEQLETIIKNSPDAIVLLDGDGVIKQANLAWLLMIGQSLGEVIGHPFVEFIGHEDQETFLVALKHTLADELENDITVEIPNQTQGSHIEVEIVLAPIIEGQESGFVCNIRDMTHHKKTERLLREALFKSYELNELKTNFVTMASHEFRTPLTTILSSSDIVAQYYEKLTSEKIVNHMIKIQREVDHLNNLIDDILVLGRTSDEGFKASYKIVNLKALVSDIIAHVTTRDENQHPISLKIADGCELIVTDEKLLSHILDNLINNACKYSSVGSQVNVQIGMDDRLFVIISDNGIGIPDEDLERLFDSFQRGSNVSNIHGTGIGLAIVRESIDALDGQIEVQSELGEGSTFKIYLPITTTAQLE